MREEIGERSSGMLPDGFCCYFHGLGAILTVGTEESIENRPEPTSQIPESPKYSLKKDLPEDAPFFLLPTVCPSFFIELPKVVRDFRYSRSIFLQPW